jgi:two-component system sensor histidine kinase RpfC
VAEAIETLLGEGGASLPASRSHVARVKTAHAAGEDLLNERILDDLVALGGDQSFIDDLLGGFRRDGDAELETARSQLTAGDLGALRDTLHALKGSARNVGATRLSERIAEIERMSDQALAPRAAELIDEVQMLLQLSWEGLQAYREGLARGERPASR